MWGIREDFIGNFLLIFIHKTAKGGFYVVPIGLGASLTICMIINCILGCKDTKLSEKYFKELIREKSKPFVERYCSIL